jgi:phage protein D
MSKIRPGTVEPVRLSVVQEARKHDVAVVVVRSLTLDWYRRLAPGAPVRLDWVGKTTGSGQFLGYVTYVKPAVKVDVNLYEMEIICTAASRALRQSAQRSWRNSTIPDIARDVGKRFGFKVITKPHPLRRPQTVQSGETYWEFLHRLARRIGYALRVEGTTLMFLPVESFVSNYRSRAPYLTSIENRRNFVEGRATIESFSALTGDTSESSEYSLDAAKVVAVLPSTGEVYTSKKSTKSATKRRRRGQPRFETSNTTVVAHSKRDADLLAQGLADNGSMAIDGRLTCMGDGSLAPYRPVYLRLPQRRLSGWWVVKSVTHNLDATTGDYRCEAVVSTDSLETSGLAPRAPRKTRDLSSEYVNGWKPGGNKSRLKTVKTGFVEGNTSSEGMKSTWVAV